MRSTALQRARRRLALAGYAVEVLRRLRGSKRRRHSPFGFLDLLAVSEGKAPLAVRLAATEAEAFALVEVLAAAPAARSWLAAGNDLQVWTLVSSGRGKQRRWLVLTIGGIWTSGGAAAAVPV
jgi:hypothetical protein